MNPQLPSREQIEERITALLLGELPAAEADLLRYAIAQDASLQKLHDELRSTIVLVREAVKPAATASAERSAPLQLSDGRRKILFQYFKTPRSKPSVWTRPIIQSPRLVTALVLVSIVALLAAMLLPALSKAKSKSQRLSVLSAAKVRSMEQDLKKESLATRTWSADNADRAVLSPTPPPQNPPTVVTVATEPPLAPPPVQIILPPPASTPDASAPVQDDKLLHEMGRFQEAGKKLNEAPNLEPETKAATYYLNLEKQAGLARSEIRGSSDTQARLEPVERQLPNTARPSSTDGDRQKLGANPGVINAFADAGGSQNSTTSGGTGGGGGGGGGGFGFAAGTPIAPASPPVEKVESLRRGTAVVSQRATDKDVDFELFDSKNFAVSDPAANGALAENKPANTFGINAVGELAADARGVATVSGVPAGGRRFYRVAPGGPMADDHQVPVLGDVPVLGKEFRSEPSTTSTTPPAPLNAGNFVAGDAVINSENLALAAPKTENSDQNTLNYKWNDAGPRKPEAADSFQDGSRRPDPRYRAMATPTPETASAQVATTNAPGFNWYLGQPVSIAKNPARMALQKPDEEGKEPLDAALALAKKKPSANTPIPQPEILTRENAFSTFSLNVSDVSFKLAAASLEKGQMPDATSIRSEEFINAFDYRDPEAAPGQPVAFASERARYPFAHNRDLLRFSVKTAAAGRAAGRALNLVLLLDTSGSMERADRVTIIREALRVLASQLQPADKVSVVTFARTARLWADGVPGDKAGETLSQVGGITPDGGTNLEEAMRLAYEAARRHYLAGGINRVVLLTDGAANLGNVDPGALKEKVEAQRRQGIALDCFGIGWEDFNDDLLEQLSGNGDGRYAFINSPEEAGTEFAAKLAGALQVAAQDVKVQVEFNPQRVISWRQIGYAKHQLTKEQFRDNSVIAAEIAAQEAGNALYTVETKPDGIGPIATVYVRYRIPGTQDVRERSWPVDYDGTAPALENSSPAMRLAAAAAAFSEWLAMNPFAQAVTPDELLKTLNGVPQIYGADQRPGKLETMIREAKSVAGK